MISIKAKDLAAKLLEHPDSEIFVCNEQGWFPAEKVSIGNEYEARTFYGKQPSAEEIERLKKTVCFFLD